MKRNKGMANYTDEPIQLGARVADFLPSPAELAEAEEVVKITLSLSKQSVEFFKREAEEHHMPYQRMIRRLLDEYVANQPVEKQ
jgi:predicted DNA binding CopG/RHH family protein